jgi:hypothetical protein
MRSRLHRSLHRIRLLHLGHYWSRCFTGLNTEIRISLREAGKASAENLAPVSHDKLLR